MSTQKNVIFQNTTNTDYVLIRFNMHLLNIYCVSGFLIGDELQLQCVWINDKDGHTNTELMHLKLYINASYK